jgi:lysophospholipase L1-like esterase
MECSTASGLRNSLRCAALLLVVGQAFGQTAISREELERVVAAQRHLLADWAGLNRYGSDNTELSPPKPGETRVVFFGDDTTARWVNFFPGKPWLNRGVARQSTPQLLVRFRQDVIALQPKVVVIQGGMNDIAGFVGQGSEGTMAENFLSMVELAKVNGIRVVLASINPVTDAYTNQTRLRPQGRIIGMNGWLRDYAAKSGSVFLNYYAALAEGRDFRKDLTADGLVPNEAGYAVMAPLAEKAIFEALAKP